MPPLPAPEPGRTAAEDFVERHLRHLIDGEIAGSPRFRGGQQAADAALDAYDVTGYATTRSVVEPVAERGASQLSPYIRHGLLQLPRVWQAVGDGPARDVRKFHDELLWQEYARHWYARLGTQTAAGTRREQRSSTTPAPGWDRTMACVDRSLVELERDGWLVNQSRMWLASDWAVRHRYPWRHGEDHFFRHLLDGSRAANRLGWQWTSGVGSSKVYGFSRWQVEKRAPALCAGCLHRNACPIADWPAEPPFAPAAAVTGSHHLFGPSEPERHAPPDAAWLTAESLGVADPALAANPELPVVFVFDAPLLTRLRLSGKRLVFLVETLAELGARRRLELRLGDPGTELSGTAVAVTHAPVPGFAKLSRRVAPVEVHPWPWLARPTDRSVSSFSAWRKSLERP